MEGVIRRPEAKSSGRNGGGGGGRWMSRSLARSVCESGCASVRSPSLASKQSADATAELHERGIVAALVVT